MMGSPSWLQLAFAEAPSLVELLGAEEEAEELPLWTAPAVVFQESLRLRQERCPPWAALEGELLPRGKGGASPWTAPVTDGCRQRSCGALPF